MWLQAAKFLHIPGRSDEFLCRTRFQPANIHTKIINPKNFLLSGEVAILRMNCEIVTNVSVGSGDFTDKNEQRLNGGCVVTKMLKDAEK